jgi:hypothetical protein
MIKGYAHFEENVRLDDLARLLGINKAIISGNNSFLTELGLIEGGKTKNATPLCKNLGRALEHSQKEDIRKYLREVVQGNEFLSDIVSTVRIKEGMTVDELASHVLYASGQPNTKGNATSARAVVDLLMESGLLIETDGQLQLATTPKQEQPETPPILPPVEKIQVKPTPPTKAAGLQPQVGVTPTATIAINIQLHLPETENAAVYEELFKALRKHLLEPVSSQNAG